MGLLKPGTRFDIFGHWYREIDEIIDMKKKYALVKAHEDDGLQIFCIMEKINENEYKSIIICNDEEGARYNFNMRIKSLDFFQAKW